MSRFTLCVTFLWMIVTMGCAHGPVHVQTEFVPSAAQSHAMEAGYAGASHWPIPSEDAYVYAVGVGKFPDDSISQAQGWARAKRAAIDNAIMNLIAEDGKQDLLASSDASQRKTLENNAEARAEQMRGSISQAEIVRIHRLQDGSCEVLMKAPRKRIFKTE